MLGAAFGALAARAGLAPAAHFALACLVFGGAAVLAVRIMPDGTADDVGSPAEGEHHVPGPTGPVLHDLRLVGLGLMTFCAAWAEGSANDWLALMLADDRGASGAAAALGFAVFAVAMTGGRLVGTPVVTRFGRVPHPAVGRGGHRGGGVRAAAGAGAGRRLSRLPSCGASASPSRSRSR